MARIAILGAGMMGSAAALRLARAGHDVVLYDRSLEPMCGASRWNEGKIHLGFLYAGDPSLRSAERILPGGLSFRPLLERLIGTTVRHVTEEPDVFLVHRASVARLDATRAYFTTLADRVRRDPAAGGYLVDVADAAVHELSPRELSRLTASDAVVGGFRVPERSIATSWVADRVVETLAAEPRVILRMSTEVLSVTPESSSRAGEFAVVTSAGADDGYDVVVNALWEGRLRVDATAGLPPVSSWTHRYRVSLFVETRAPQDVSSFVICTGPFGDVKRYSARHFYLSWYPAGLLAMGEDLVPPLVPRLDAAAVAACSTRIVEALAGYVPAVRAVAASADSVILAGGWVFAVGQGLLSDPQATLHRRDQVGIRRTGRYFSVDTGKYSIAPWLAEHLVPQVNASLA